MYIRCKKRVLQENYRTKIRDYRNGICTHKIDGIPLANEIIKKAEKYMGTFYIPDGEVATAPVKESVNGYTKAFL